MPKKASLMNPNAALIAGSHGEQSAVVDSGKDHVKCTRQSAQSAAKKLLYPSGLAATVQCTVAIASAHEDLAQEQAGKYSVIEPRKSAAFSKMQHSSL
jgi:hypothetical protein